MILILNAEPEGYSHQARHILETLGELVEESCDRTRLLQLVPDFEVLIVRLGHMVDDELLARGERLKAVVTATTGLNHVDLDAASRRGIAVLCLKDERAFLDNLTATAELAWALLLNLVRRVNQANLHVMDGGWDRDQFQGSQLKDKTLGIIGFGRLGGIIAEYGRAFRMKLVACDPFVKKMPDWLENVEMAELLDRSDVISLHVNLDQTTTGLLDYEAFSKIKPGVVLINTSRGELIDESAMLEALESGRLAGVGLDVLNGEAMKSSGWPEDNPVWQYAQSHDNILLVPHIGGATIETMEQTELFMAQKLAKFLNGEIVC